MLWLEGDFNQPIDGVRWQGSLEGLVFGRDFNQQIGAVAWPPSLPQLKFGRGFNQPIAAVHSVAFILQNLKFAMCFNQPIADVCWPDSLQTLNFSNNKLPGLFHSVTISLAAQKNKACYLTSTSLSMK